MKFIPANFKVPKKLETRQFRLRQLCARDVYLDYQAVMSSIAVIRKTRGGKWPTAKLTFEDDLLDLAWHRREFERKSSFAYTVMNPTETECFGCVYLYPPGYRKHTPIDCDLDISFWVTRSAYTKSLYPQLYKSLQKWLHTSWPFKKPYWSNVNLPTLTSKSVDGLSSIQSH